MLHSYPSESLLCKLLWITRVIEQSTKSSLAGRTAINGHKQIARQDYEDSTGHETEENKETDLSITSGTTAVFANIRH